MEKNKHKKHDDIEVPAVESPKRLTPKLDVHGSPIRDANGNELFEEAAS